MSSTAGTPPSPHIHLPSLSPEQPKSGILINPEPERLSIAIPPSSPGLPTPVSAGKSPSSGQPRIRFAPLPEPRPRSLSTGENIAWKTSEDADGNETRHMEVRNIPQSSVSYDTDEAISEGEDDDHDRRMRGRSWSKGMESSWKISKKILTVGMWDDKDEKKETYDGGMPLKKSVSTGGMIGSSPFRWSSVEDRRRSMQSLPAPAPSHRRTSSIDPPSAAALGSSPTPVKIKLMNGRVYGARRASEIAEMQKKVREAAEPEFVEWGNAKQGTAATASTGGGRGLLGDDDDGSGMDWVKKRREARQRRESEKQLREAAEPPAEPPQLVHAHSSPEAETTVTPASKPAELPPTPVIQISEPVSPSSASAPMDIDRKEAPPDVFEDDEEEEGDDGDFSSDEEEEEEIDRTTSSAAGIEIMSRHHH